MAALSFVVIPVFVRFIITPLILLRISRSYFSEKHRNVEPWQEEASRELFGRMYARIKKILLRSESFQVSENIQSLLILLLPPGQEATEQTFRFDFTPIRFLETLLLAYEDLYKTEEKRFLLRYLLKRKAKWFRPFLHGMKYQRMINTIPIVEFFNKKGLFSQVLRLILIPLIGLPGIVVYTIRSVLIRGIWTGLIRYYYASFLLKLSYYLIHLYGGNNEELTRRRQKFSRKEIIRKGMHYERELSLMPNPEKHFESLNGMIEKYKEILSEAGFAPDPVYSLEETPQGKGHSLRKKFKGLVKRTLSAVNQQLADEEDQPPGMRETALRLLKELPGEKYPGSPQPWLNYKILQGINVTHRLLLLSLSRIYTNAPGSHFAMKKMSVDLIRQARDFSRHPFVSLLSKTGKTSYKAVKPLLRLRRLNRIRKNTTPTGLISLSIPLLGKLIQDRWKELILYRLGRAVIRYSILEDETLSPP